MLKISPLSRRTKSAENIKIVIDFVGDRDEPGLEEVECHVTPPPAVPAVMVHSPSPSPLSVPRKSLQENSNSSLLKSGPNGDKTPRRKSFDVAADSDRRPSVIGTLIHRINLPAMKKSDLKSSGSGKASKQLVPRGSPLMAKKSPGQDSSSSQSPAGLGAPSVPGSQQDDLATVIGTSSEDLPIALADNGSDTGTDEVDGIENSTRTKQVIEALQVKIMKTKEAIRKEQNNKESIVNEYLQMATDKQPTARIKTLFEKKNQKSAQNIIQLQRKLENYQHRLTEVETHGYTGHKQAKEVLRDVGQGLNTIVSKPKEFAHLIKNKFGSADNIAQLKLEDPAAETDGKSGGTLPASFKYASDDETSSITSGSGLGGLQGSPHSSQMPQMAAVSAVNQAAMEALREELRELRETSRKSGDVILRLVEEFEDYKTQMQSEVGLVRSLLEDEKFRVERLEEQLNDLTELHQHEVMNMKQDLSSMEEKIEYRLDERTTDLSDLVDNASTRISRLEQQQQQQQILSMEMVENATFRTIISKLINVVLALLAVVLVFVSTGANFLSPFIHSKSRVVISVLLAILSWFAYQHYSYIEATSASIRSFFTWPWS